MFAFFTYVLVWLRIFMYNIDYYVLIHEYISNNNNNNNILLLLFFTLTTIAIHIHT